MLPDHRAAFPAFCERHYGLLRAAVLATAVFNLTFRLGREVVYEWDEALYAIAAWEMQVSGNWIGTTFLGDLDYYNSKPPLNVWLIALAFKAFGRDLVSLRLVSAISATLTVVALQEFARRVCGPAIAVLAGAVLATTFAFVYVHAGRTAETDALFTLLVLLVVITLWAERRHAWARAWLGPLTAAVFLLRGMAVLMPIAIIVAVGVSATPVDRRSRWPTIAAFILFSAPVATWGVLRWRLDEWRFFDGLFNYDFIARSFTAIEGHHGTPFYYLKILGKHHYDWLIAAAVACTLFPIPLARLRNLLLFWRNDDRASIVLGAWAVVTFVLPSAMATKLPWYLGPFYPAFALGIASILAQGLSETGSERRTRGRRTILAAVVVSIFLIAQGKLISYSYHHRNLRRSIQGLLLDEKERLAGQQVFRRKWDNAEIFVLGGVVGAEWRTGTLDDFWRDSRPGDCLVSRDIEQPGLMWIRSRGRDSLHCRSKN